MKEEKAIDDLLNRGILLSTINQVEAIVKEDPTMVVKVVEVKGEEEKEN